MLQAVVHDETMHIVEKQTSARNRLHYVVRSHFIIFEYDAIVGLKLNNFNKKVLLQIYPTSANTVSNNQT